MAVVLSAADRWLSRSVRRLSSRSVPAHRWGTQGDRSRVWSSACIPRGAFCANQPVTKTTALSCRLSTTANAGSQHPNGNDEASAGATREYADDEVRSILQDCRTIAVVGASPRWNRPSNFVIKYMQNKGYRVIPVNPVAKGKVIHGEKTFASLGDVAAAGVTVDMVSVFRSPAEAPDHCRSAIAAGAKVLWLQLGIVSDEAERIGREAGLRVVMDRCPKIEYSRLYGELGLHGFNTNVISSRRRRTPTAGGTAGAATTGKGKGFETRCIHAGAAPDPTTGARSTPIYQTTSFVFESVDEAADLFNLSTFGNIYGRLSNPTTAVLEERIANLENGRGATAASSGHAAQLLALFPLMEPGDCIVASNKLYGGTLTQFGKTISKFGWRCRFVDADEPANVAAALSEEPRAKAVWTESLANPGGVVTDIAALAEIARDNGVPLMVDNTMASPALCKPIDHGASLVVHSTTKFLSGHGNAMGGVVVDSGKFDWSASDKFPALSRPCDAYHGLNFAETFGDMAFTMYAHAVGLRDLGPCMAPLHAYLTLMGIETLPLRMRQHCSNAQRVASFLASHPAVGWVSYAGLESSKYKSLAEQYLPGGAGSIFTFGVKGGFPVGVRVVEACNVISHLANIGDTRSLILHPASTTHRQLTADERVSAGAGDDVIRLSVGLESVDDIIDDLDQALNSALVD